MPSSFGYERNDSKRIQAWKDHIIQKGCHPVKAYDVALKKCRKSITWP